MKTLLVGDVQNDFVPGGALAVPDGDAIVPVINKLQGCFALVVATQDWHPANHGSFAANHPGKKPGQIIDLHGFPQILWPVHCVQNTPGAAFVPGLETRKIERIFHKGTDPRIDSYSGFFDNEHRKSTGLGEYLQSRQVRDLYIAGLATDYCMKYTALDALRFGFKTYLIADACRGINLQPGDVDRALADLKKAGVEIVQSSDILCLSKV